MPANVAFDLIEVRHLAQDVLGELLSPPRSILVDSSGKPRAKRSRVNTAVLGLAPEDVARFDRVDAKRLEQYMEIKQVAALQTLKDASQLFPRDFERCIHSDDSVVREIRPTPDEPTLLGFYYEFVISDVEFQRVLTAKRASSMEPAVSEKSRSAEYRWSSR